MLKSCAELSKSISTGQGESHFDLAIGRDLDWWAALIVS
jgi:hypothetical protein